MRVYVASWFFPPSTSSEGIVAYKLLRNSENTYEVCCSESDQWGYDQKISINADNITLHPIRTDDIDVWVREAVDVFEELNAAEPFDCIMTRCMPPESILVAKAIIENHSDVKWIASFGDPVSRIPIHIQDFVNKSKTLSKKEKADFKLLLNRSQLPKETEWDKSDQPGIKLMCQYKRWEDYAVTRADAIVVPNGVQAEYLLNGRRREGVYIIGHSYDCELFPPILKKHNERIEFVFMGFADKVRSLEPFVQALHRMQIDDPDLLKKIHVRFIGNIVDESSTLIYNYYLFDTISIEPSVSYIDSLRIMQQADWLLHVDTYFDFLWNTGGSLYFAGKLADYFGSQKPILAVTGRHSPADHMVRRAGGRCYDGRLVNDIAEAFEEIAAGTDNTEIDEGYRKRFAASVQAQKLDFAIEEMIKKDASHFSRPNWPLCKPSSAKKLITICIPSYNVEQYLDRCLMSLVSCTYAELLEILVVNDDSPDDLKIIASAYEKKYPGIVKLVNKRNGGHGSTINKALTLAKGKYFKVVDGDDWVDTAEMSKLINDLISRDVDADLISTNYYQVDMKSGKTTPWARKESFKDYKAYEFSEYDFTKEYFTIHSTFYKTDVLRRANLQLQENTFFVDVEFIMLPLPWVETIMFSPRYVYRYAIGNTEQSIDTVNFVRRYDHHLRVMKRIISFYCEKQDGLSKGQNLYCRELIKKHLVTHYSLCLVYDTDWERGCARAKEFDGFLKSAMPDMYQLLAREYRIIGDARKKHFDPSQMKQPARIDTKKTAGTIQRVSRKAARKVMRGGVGKVVADEVSKHQKK